MAEELQAEETQTTNHRNVCPPHLPVSPFFKGAHTDKLNSNKKNCGCNQDEPSCHQKIILLEKKLEELSQTREKKAVYKIYDIGNEMTHYLVQFRDQQLQKFAVEKLRSMYLREYITFLEEKCFCKK